jgi:hypothetical protein
MWESKPTLGVQLFGMRITSCGTSAAATFVLANRSYVSLGVAKGPPHLGEKLLSIQQDEKRCQA